MIYVKYIIEFNMFIFNWLGECSAFGLIQISEEGTHLLFRVTAMEGTAWAEQREAPQVR